MFGVQKGADFKNPANIYDAGGTPSPPIAGAVSRPAACPEALLPGAR